MTRRIAHRLTWISKVFSVSIVTILAVSVVSFNDASASQSPTIAGSYENKLDNSLMQFKAGNHVVGFVAKKVYLVSPDHALTVEFLGTNGVTPRVEDHAPAMRSATKAQSLTKVVYQNLWDGIGLTYEATKDGITESAYQLAPGADVSKIRLKYNVPVEKQKNGYLKFRFETGNLTESAPIAWQEVEGRRIPVTVAFKVSGDEVGFSVGQYDCNKPLVIDPVYSWNTFYGTGTGLGDIGYGIAVDGNDNVYVTGTSYGTWGTPLNGYPGGVNGDIFVLKLNGSGALQWNTFYGAGTGLGDNGYGIAVDGSGNVYVTGQSYGTWGTPLNAYNGGVNGDIFVLKLNSSGSLQWNTFYGSGSGDGAYGIAVDGSGNVHVTGFSYGTWGTPLNAFSGAPNGDIFVLKLNGSGTHQWNTFYGSGSGDVGFDVAVDGSGNVHVTGQSFGTWGTPLNAFSGGANGDLFVLKLNGSGTYQWNTFYGSGNGDQGNGIVVDSSGNPYVAGHSFATWGTPLNAFSGVNGNILVLKLNSSGSLQWNTFYGSGSGDDGLHIALDRGGNEYVSGLSQETWNGPSGQIPLNAFSGSGNAGVADIMALKLDSSGAYQWHGFYGSGIRDEGWGIAVDGSGNVDVTGFSLGTWGTPLNAFSGDVNGDVSVLQLKLSTCPATAVEIAETSNTYPSIQNAYGAAVSGQSILIQALTLGETLNLNRPINVLLQGGYECNFPSAPPGISTINGSVTISNGTVTIGNLIVVQ